MNAVKLVGTLIVALLVLFLFRVIYLTTPILEMIVTSPWWVHLIMIGIIVSGYLSYKFAKEDREIEERWIEQEGENFMEPIRKRREKIT